jgi:hypothetical protein
MPNPKSKPKAQGTTLPHGSTFMDIQPLDPRQAQPLDMTVPHALDQTLPDVSPQIVQPKIAPPVGTPSDYQADPQRLHPGDFTRPGFSDTKKI